MCAMILLAPYKLYPAENNCKIGNISFQIGIKYDLIHLASAILALYCCDLAYISEIQSCLFYFAHAFIVPINIFISHVSNYLPGVSPSGQVPGRRLRSLALLCDPSIPRSIPGARSRRAPARVLACSALHGRGSALAHAQGPCARMGRPYAQALALDSIELASAARSDQGGDRGQFFYT
jgi:hypothetical protein